MNNQHFDAVVRAFGKGVSRRGFVVMLAGAASMRLGAVEGKHKRRTKQPSVTICHHDQGADTWHPIRVPPPTAAKHISNHGDFRYDVTTGECCTGVDCGPGKDCTIRRDAAGKATGPGICISSSCPSAGVCTDHLICGEKQVHCDPGPGSGCSCTLSVEGCFACINENFCGPACTSSAECEASLGTGAICQRLGTGCCGQTCAWPCGQEPSPGNLARSQGRGGPRPGK